MKDQSFAFPRLARLDSPGSPRAVRLQPFQAAMIRFYASFAAACGAFRKRPGRSYKLR